MSSYLHGLDLVCLSLGKSYLVLVAYLNLGKSLISRSLNCGIDTFQGCRDFCDLRRHQGTVLMRNEVVGNFKGGEKQKSPAMELLKQRVETWILARKNHIHLDKVSSTIGSQKGNYHSFPLSLSFFCYLVLTHLCNELIRKKTNQSENIVFTMSYTLRRDKKKWDIFLYSRKIDILELFWWFSG